jgi:polyvinyl alcohol dehydrogenase (cytochrome)
VLLAGSLDGKVRALRTSDGQELWVFDTSIDVVDVQGVAGHGGSIDSAGPVPAGRDLYVNSGYSTFGGANPWQGGNGNALFVFRLP